MGPIYVIVICGEHQSNEKRSVVVEKHVDDRIVSYELSDGTIVKPDYCVRVK